MSFNYNFHFCTFENIFSRLIIHYLHIWGFSSLFFCISFLCFVFSFTNYTNKTTDVLTHRVREFLLEWINAAHFSYSLLLILLNLFNWTARSHVISAATPVVKRMWGNTYIKTHTYKPMYVRVCACARVCKKDGSRRSTSYSRLRWSYWVCYSDPQLRGHWYSFKLMKFVMSLSFRLTLLTKPTLRLKSRLIIHLLSVDTFDCYL